MSFESEIAEITAAYEALLLAVARKAQLDMFTDCVMGCPVDSGRARGNFQASEGSPANGETGVVDPSGGSTVAAGTAVIAAAQPGDWWITNNVPYIIPLEMGHSQQAPAGWVGAAAVRFNKNVEVAVAALAGGA